MRNEWSYTSVLPIRLHGLHKEKDTFYVFCHDFIQSSVDDAFHAWLKEEEGEACCIRNNSKEPIRKANIVSGSSYFVTKINLTRKFTK